MSERVDGWMDGWLCRACIYSVSLPESESGFLQPLFCR